MSNTEQQTPAQALQKLTQAQATEIAGALARLKEIRELTELGKTAEILQEASALTEYLAGQFALHGDELIGAWFAMTFEYGPLIRGVAPAFRRVFGIIDQQERAQSLSRDNVVVLAEEAK